jgi:hypothetical protein
MSTELMISRYSQVSYPTKSAKLSVCNGLLEKLDTSSSAIDVEPGKCDHLCAAVVGWCLIDSHL